MSVDDPLRMRQGSIHPVGESGAESASSRDAGSPSADAIAIARAIVVAIRMARRSGGG